MPAKPPLKLLRCHLGSGTRTKRSPNDHGLAFIVAFVFMVGYELQRIVDQLRKIDDLAVAEFRQLTACRGIGLA